MNNRSPIVTQEYLDKADHLLHGMRRLSESYRTGVALLAVHSAISLNDAVVVGVRGIRIKAEDHSAAIRELETICGELRIDERNGVQHFRYLVGRKTNFAYSSERISDSELKLATDRAERFANWAYKHFKEVLGVRRS